MKGKLIAAFLSAAFLSTNSSQAQLFTGEPGKDSTQPKIGFGVKAGANMQTISGDIWDNTSKTGPTGGFFVRMYKKKFGGRAEVMVSSMKLTSPVITDSMGNKGDFRATSLDIPVMLEYSIIPRLAVMAGMQYTNLLSVANLTDINGDIKKIFKQGEFSAVVGLEVKLPYKISVGGRYRYGLSNINNTTISGTTDRWSTQAIHLYVAYNIK